MHIRAKKKKDVLVVFLKGELDHHTASRVRQYIDDMLEDPTIKNIIIDMKELNFMDSSGIGVLIGRYKVVSKRGGNLGVVHIKPHIHRIFEVSGLYNILKTFEGLQEALNHMGGY